MLRVAGVLSAFLFALFIGSAAFAGPTDPVIKPVGVTGSPDTATSFSGGAGELINLINGDTDASQTNNGLIKDGTVNPQVPAAVVTEDDALTFEHRNIFTGEPALAQWHWVTAGRNGGDFSDFFDPAGNHSPIWIAFDLGGSFDVSGMYVWRYNGGFGSIEQNNPKDWTIEFSKDGGANYGNLETIPTLTNSGLGGESVKGELLSFAAQQANFVRITITDNFKGEPGLAFGGDRVGLAEVRFQGLHVVANKADYNGNGVVDAADYTVWRDTLGSTTDLRADGSGNGVVGPEDFQFWKTNFGSAGPGSTASTSVPEPGSAVLLLVASLVLYATRFCIGNCVRG